MGSHNAVADAYKRYEGVWSAVGKYERITAQAWKKLEADVARALADYNRVQTRAMREFLRAQIATEQARQ